MSVIFPRRRPDGSFSFELRFVSDGLVDGAVSITPWLSAWAESNREWVREWSGGFPPSIVQTDVLRLSAAFRKAPSLAERREHSVQIRMDSTPEAAFWKDWVVKFVGDFMAEFPQFRFEGATSVD